MMPWVHLFISQEGNVGPCCLAPWTSDKTFGNINKETIGAIWNGAEIKNLEKNCWPTNGMNAVGSAI